MTEEASQPDSNEAKPDVAQAPKGKLTMAVKIYAPFKIYFEGEVYSVSAVNGVGPFDILPKHHNFLCMLVPCNLVVETPKGQQTVKIHRALMHVKADRVVVFVDV